MGAILVWVCMGGMLLLADAMGSPAGMEEVRTVMGAWGDIGGMYDCDCTREL